MYHLHLSTLKYVLHAGKQSRKVPTPPKKKKYVKQYIHNMVLPLKLEHFTLMHWMISKIDKIVQ